MPAPDLVLDVADQSDLETLLPLVRDYHAFEHVVMTDSQRIAAIEPLLQAGSRLGRIWLARWDGEVVGYGALCFGYSIEFRGRDAFIDELFVAKQARGHGFGSHLLSAMKAEAAALGIVALHLEVARTNAKAQQLYIKQGFHARKRYHLMSCDIGRAI